MNLLKYSYLDNNSPKLIKNFRHYMDLASSCIAAGGSRAGAAGRFIRRSNASPATTATSGVTSGYPGRMAAMLVEDLHQLGFQANSGSPGMWTGTKYMTRGTQAVGLEKGEPWAPCCCFVTLSSLLVIYLIHSIKMICSKKIWESTAALAIHNQLHQGNFLKTEMWITTTGKSPRQASERQTFPSGCDSHLGLQEVSLRRP